MTIAVGMRCQDGFVLTVDRQLTAPGGHKYQEDKIYRIWRGDSLSKSKYKIVVTYAGSPGLFQEVNQKMLYRLAQIPDVTCEGIRDGVDEIVTEMGRTYVTVDLELLIAYHVTGEIAELLKFDGKALYVVPGLEVLGVGDSALIKYLTGALYYVNSTVDYGQNLAIYLVSQANKYIDKCGGGPDVAVLTNDGELYFPPESEVSTKESAMKNVERDALLQVIKAAGKTTMPPNP
jgi:20S proteasome alpha/beta subunit